MDIDLSLYAQKDTVIRVVDVYVHANHHGAAVILGRHTVNLAHRALVSLSRNIDIRLLPHGNLFQIVFGDAEPHIYLLRALYGHQLSALRGRLSCYRLELCDHAAEIGFQPVLHLGNGVQLLLIGQFLKRRVRLQLRLAARIQNPGL